jgi:TonB family protein
MKLALLPATAAPHGASGARLGTRTAAELEACRRRTRRCMAASAVVHALLLLAIVLLPKAAPGEPELTEFMLLEPGDLAAGADAPSTPAAASRTQEGTARADADDEHFRRTAPVAEIEPSPQNDVVAADRLASRLATLQNVSATRVVGVAETKMPGTGGALAPAPVTGGGGGSTTSLHRGDALGQAPSLSLSRGGGGGSAPTLAAAPVPKAASAASEPAGSAAASARRTLYGASLAGPIADRPVLSYSKPVYPDWAKKELVGGSVTLYFVVRPDGTVKENILVQQTAGFEDFDESARTALRAWRFAPLAGGRTGEQWGTITFHFRLQEGS